ncbi:3760_t:CDS:1 [Paraglomus occultum]|uniref:Phosphatidylglycerol/phosphatidylinositol transfer protein n=1 Tax=Paraglomus occultum TaxID=144539 RepID=A0A9N9FUH3_9GLOM|nr:3760_t:CDS:1 [Paraglomus occultum]
MKHPIFFLFFVLVATVSVINAIPYGLSKRTTKFGVCGETEPHPPLLDVSISPDPIVSGQSVTFSVAGTAPVDISSAFALFFFYNDKTKYNRNFGDKFCNFYNACPVKKNDKFQFNYTVNPNDLPNSYSIDVKVMNLDIHLNMCATATV